MHQISSYLLQRFCFLSLPLPGILSLLSAVFQMLHGNNPHKLTSVNKFSFFYFLSVNQIFFIPFRVLALKVGLEESFHFFPVF